MSGPKVSSVQLERQRQAELRRRQQERIQALEKYTQATQRLDALARKVEVIYESSIRNFEQDNEMRTEVHVIRAAADDAAKNIRTLCATQPKGEAEQIKTQTRSMQSRTTEIERSFDAATSLFDKQVEQYLAMLHEQQGRKAFSEKLAQCKEERRVFHIVSFALASEVPPDPKTLDADGLIAEIKFLIKHPAIGRNRDTLLALVSAITKEPEQMRQQALLEQYIVLRNGIWQDKREFGLYYKQYHALYFAWAQTRYAGKLEFPPPKPQSEFSSVNEIKNEVSRLQHEYEKEDEAAYIREGLDKVMCEFGYLTLKPIQLRDISAEQNCFLAGNHFLAKSTVSGDAPLHIEIGDDGTFLIEPQCLEGTDGDNYYDDSGEMSPAEKEYITNQQIDFCRQYPKMIERLKELGIIFNSKLYMEPGDRCTKLIIRGEQSVFNQYQEIHSKKYDDKPQEEFAKKQGE